MTDHPPHLSEAQRLACESFDLEATLAALPPHGSRQAAQTTQGQAGIRLRPNLVADLPDDLLREFATTTLGAVRCSERYLDALRVVLGNQADAERNGYRLELNTRVPFASEKTMRGILSQMEAAGIIHGVPVGLGQGRAQTVLCFTPCPEARSVVRSDAQALAVLIAMQRQREELDDKGRSGAQALRRPPATIEPGAVPF